MAAGARMLGGELALEIRVLAKHGMGVREIAREAGVSRNTVRRYLRDPEAARYRARPPRPGKLDGFAAYVAGRVAAAAPLGGGPGADGAEHQRPAQQGRRLGGDGPEHRLGRAARGGDRGDPPQGGLALDEAVHVGRHDRIRWPVPVHRQRLSARR